MNLPLRKITSLSAAYSLQEDASRELSESCRGYALTGTSEKSRRFLGLECPIYSLLTDSDILDHPTSFRVPRGAIGFGCELTFVFGRNYPCEDEELTMSSLAQCIVACYGAIRIIGRRVPGSVPLTATTAVADFGLNVALIRCVEVAGWDNPDFPEMDIEAYVDGVGLSKGRAGDLDGHPLSGVLDLAKILRQQNRMFEAGMHVTSGSCTTILQTPVGHEIAARFAGAMAPPIMLV